MDDETRARFRAAARGALPARMAECRARVRALATELAPVGTTARPGRAAHAHDPATVARHLAEVVTG